MLSRPTTEQILLDCCRELMTAVLPALTDETAQVSVIMVETVLRNAAVRAAHEVAWMREETAEIESYAQTVAEQASGTASASADTLRAALGSAVAEELLTRNVAAVVRLPVSSKRKRNSNVCRHKSAPTFRPPRKRSRKRSTPWLAAFRSPGSPRCSSPSPRSAIARHWN